MMSKQQVKVNIKEKIPAITIVTNCVLCSMVWFCIVDKVRIITARLLLTIILFYP